MITLLAKQLSEILKSDPQTREELCAQLNCDDRSLRRAAAELRNVGFNIASSSHSKGYWLGTKEEMEALANEYDERGWMCYQVAWNIRRGPDLGQMEVEL